MEDERIFGSVEWGLGSQGKSLGGAYWDAAAHTDGIVLNPTVYYDGKVFEKDGVFLDETAREFCRKLGIAGY